MKKIALVTGASKGLGFGWCEALGKKGYHILVTARSLDAATAASEKLKAMDISAEPFQLDVSSEEAIARLARQVADKYDQLDLLINNAGINPKDYADKERMAKAFKLDQLDFAEMEWVYRVNSLAPLVMVKHFKSLLLKSANPLVTNVSSWLSSVTNVSFGGHYGYVSSKNLLNVLNKSMALEIRDLGIISVNVNPGWVQTSMGGKKATFTPVESATNCIENVLEKVTINETGSFFNHDGFIHPW